MNARPASLLFRFRPMQLEDVPSVHAIDMLSFALPWSERSYRFEITENHHSVVWVVEAQPEDAAQAGDNSATQPVIIGMIVLWVIIDEAHIATVAIHPDYRGLGLGRQLLARGLLAAYQRGARMAYLEVRRGNQVAQALYHQFGFTVVGERLRYYKDNNEDALLMTLAELQPEQLQQFAR